MPASRPYLVQLAPFSTRLPTILSQDVHGMSTAIDAPDSARIYPPPRHVRQRRQQQCRELYANRRALGPLGRDSLPGGLKRVGSH
jgi:hypothetical protein